MKTTCAAFRQYDLEAEIIGLQCEVSCLLKLGGEWEHGIALRITELVAAEAKLHDLAIKPIIQDLMERFGKTLDYLAKH